MLKVKEVFGGVLEEEVVAVKKVHKKRLFNRKSKTDVNMDKHQLNKRLKDCINNK